MTYAASQSKANRALGKIALRASIALLCVTALVGCSTMKGWFSTDKKKAAAPSALVEFQPSAQPAQLWTANVGKGEGNIGARQGPAIAEGRVYAAAVTGGVHAYELQTGAKLWSYPSKLKLTGGPGVGEGVVAVGSLDGEIIALDAATGAEKWIAKVGNEIIAAPAIGMGMVFVRSNDGRITAFDASNGEQRWFWNHDVPMLSVRGNDPPTLGPGYLFVGNDDGTVVALSANDGRPLWEESVAPQEGRTELTRMADVDGSPLLDDSTLYASSYKGKTMAIDAPSGQPMWISDHGGPGRIAVAPNVLVVSDSGGNVYGLYKAGGSAMWTQPAMLRRNLTAPAIQGDYAVVGDLDGYLHWMSLDTGEFAARARVGRDRLLSAPRVADGVLVVQDVGGKLSAFRLGQ